VGAAGAMEVEANEVWVDLSTLANRPDIEHLTGRRRIEENTMMYPNSMSSSINRLHAKVSPGAAYALRQLDLRIDEQIMAGRSHWVYLLAFARRETFYIDLTDEPKSIYGKCTESIEAQAKVVGVERVKPLRLVWFQTFDDAAAAQARVDELKATPHAWQRQLVDQFNPDWINLDDYMIGFPYLWCVGERGSVLFKDAMNRPEYQ
jgi:putative endonuclease